MEQIPSRKVIESTQTVDRHLRRSVDSLVIAGFDRDSIVWLLKNLDSVSQDEADMAVIYVNKLLEVTDFRQYHDLEPLTNLLAVQRALSKVSNYLVLLESSELYTRDV